MSGYLLACLWGLAALASFVGWGRLLGLALLGSPRPDLGRDIALGLSGTIALGAWLNLGRIISSELLIGYVVVGAVLAVALLTPRSTLGARWFHDEPDAPIAARPGPGGRTLLALPWLVLGGLALFRYAASAQVIELCPSDDPVAYLLFPVRMLSEGCLGDDPFNNRRLISSLGGLAFLQAIVLSATGTARAALADSGLGLIAAVAACAGLAAARRLPPALRIVPAALVVLDPFPASNLSGFVLPVPLILSLYQLLIVEPEGRSRPGRLIAVGLVASSLATLKSSMIPLVAAFLATDALARSRTDRRRAFADLAAVVLVGLVLVAPWMASLRASSGTYLYPILGAGTHGKQYGTFHEPNYEFTRLTVLKNAYQIATDGPAVAAFLLAAGGLAVLARTRRARSADVGLAVAWVATMGLMASQFEFKDTLRYAHPLHVAVALIFSIRLIECAGECRSIHAEGLPDLLIATIVASLGVGLLVGNGWEQSRSTYRKAAARVRAGLSGLSLEAESDRRSYDSLQDSIPPGVPILTRLSRGDLLDFRRNPIRVADWPGGASPSPGMPCFRGPEPLARYLLNQGIRYVAYSYADQCNFPRRDHDYTTFTLWDRVACLHAYDFQDNLAELMKTRRRAYDDGRLVMIDLGGAGN